MYVSIHAPAKGAAAQSATASFEQNLFQSTLLRKERLAGCNFCYTCNVVSIHAPAKGATVCAVEYGVLHANVSIHAPAKGATISYTHENKDGGCFNPRSCERSDSNFTQIII